MPPRTDHTRTAFGLATLVTVATFAAGALAYDGLPDPMPTHWGSGGGPDAYSPKGFVSVFTPCLVLIGVLVVFAGIAAAARSGAVRQRDASAEAAGRAERQGRLTGEFLGWTALLVALLVAVIACSIWWTDDHNPPAWLFWTALAGFLLATLALVVWLMRTVRSQDARTPISEDEARHYRAGLFYVNRDDVRLVVPKRYGVGVDLNLGRPIAWVILAVLVVGLPAAVIAATSLT